MSRGNSCEYYRDALIHYLPNIPVKLHINNTSTAHVTYLRDTGATISLLTATDQTANQLEYTGERVTIRGVNYTTW